MSLARTEWAGTLGRSSLDTPTTRGVRGVISAGGWGESPETVSVELIHDTSEEELAAELDRLFDLDMDEVEDRIDELAIELLPASDTLLRFIANEAHLSSDRALAARIWVRTLSPTPPAANPAVRVQHPKGVPPQYEALLQELASSTSVLVRLGLLEGLDDVSDFVSITKLFLDDGDERVRTKAKRVLQQRR